MALLGYSITVFCVHSNANLTSDWAIQLGPSNTMFAIYKNLLSFNLKINKPLVPYF